MNLVVGSVVLVVVLHVCELLLRGAVARHDFLVSRLMVGIVGVELHDG